MQSSVRKVLVTVFWDSFEINKEIPHPKNPWCLDYVENAFWLHLGRLQKPPLAMKLSFSIVFYNWFYNCNFEKNCPTLLNILMLLRFYLSQNKDMVATICCYHEKYTITFLMFDIGWVQLKRCKKHKSSFWTNFYLLNVWAALSFLAFEEHWSNTFFFNQNDLF